MSRGGQNAFQDPLASFKTTGRKGHATLQSFCKFETVPSFLMGDWRTSPRGFPIERVDHWLGFQGSYPTKSAQCRPDRRALGDRCGGRRLAGGGPGE